MPTFNIRIKNHDKINRTFLSCTRSYSWWCKLPVRAFFKGVGGTPVFIQKAKGAYIYDTEGKQYIDYVGSWGQ